MRNATPARTDDTTLPWINATGANGHYHSLAFGSLKVSVSTRGWDTSAWSVHVIHTVTRPSDDPAGVGEHNHLLHDRLSHRDIGTAKVAAEAFVYDLLLGDRHGPYHPVEARRAAYERLLDIYDLRLVGVGDRTYLASTTASPALQPPQHSPQHSTDGISL